jgi:two-component system response regulator PilR (NtrC family)
MNKNIDGIEPETMRRLEVYDWPGNVRELENTIERAVALEGGTRITVDALPERVRNRYREPLLPVPHNGQGAVLPEGGLNLEEHIQQVERSYLLAALESSGGIRTQAADLLKMSYRSFRHYAKKYGV